MSYNIMDKTNKLRFNIDQGNNLDFFFWSRFDGYENRNCCNIILLDRRYAKVPLYLVGFKKLEYDLVSDL